MIHEDTGEVDLAYRVRVGPAFTESEFLRSELSQISKARTDPSRSEYKMDRQLISGRQFRVTLSFHRGKLETIELFLVGAESKAFWNDWSDQEEVERKKDHDEWLESSLGAPPYNYAWGQITSDADPQGGYSRIVLRYTAQTGA
jgi:hypothetical protein